MPPPKMRHDFRCRRQRDAICRRHADAERFTILSPCFAQMFYFERASADLCTDRRLPFVAPRRHSTPRPPSRRLMMLMRTPRRVRPRYATPTRREAAPISPQLLPPPRRRAIAAGFLPADETSRCRAAMPATFAAPDEPPDARAAAPDDAARFKHASDTPPMRAPRAGRLLSYEAADFAAHDASSATPSAVADAAVAHGFGCDTRDYRRRASAAVRYGRRHAAAISMPRVRAECYQIARRRWQPFSMREERRTDYAVLRHAMMTRRGYADFAAPMRVFCRLPPEPAAAARAPRSPPSLRAALSSRFTRRARRVIFASRRAADVCAVDIFAHAAVICRRRRFCRADDDTRAASYLRAMPPSRRSKRLPRRLFHLPPRADFAADAPLPTAIMFHCFHAAAASRRDTRRCRAAEMPLRRRRQPAFSMMPSAAPRRCAVIFAYEPMTRITRHFDATRRFRAAALDGAVCRCAAV